MDCTGSMGSYIRQCKDEINDIVKAIQDENPGVNTRVCFVGYRDFDMGDRSLSVQKFTKNIKEFEDFMRLVRADGGGDAAEDMCSGFEQALLQNWGPDSTKVAVIVADAPCHGKKFQPHANSSDNHPNGDPNGRNIE